MLNKIITGNSVDVMKKLEDKSIDLTVTSPPYDNLREYKGYSFDFENIAKELFRITAEGGILVWIVSDAVINGSESGTSFKQALYFKEIGFNLHDTMIWEKDTFSFPDKTRYRSVFEYMFILSKGKPKTFNLIDDRNNKYSGTKVHGTSRGKDGITFEKSNHNKSIVKDKGIRFNVWKCPSEKNNVFGHPAVFLEKLIEDHILSWSNKGDLVLDCFSGSGTTAVVALRNGRKYLGIEISKEYVKMSEKRLSTLTKSLF